MNGNLKRHLNVIAIGGVIDTGLVMASVTSISAAELVTGAIVRRRSF